ncbi:MAG: hypothetical protein JSU05_12085 [Bacteroidetes bacterium]|nr:hypothetical protein [Bacteroidota bacterium]
MKKRILGMGLILSSFVFMSASAQVRVSINIESQPVWGPIGYDHVDYYYLPDIDIFYYVPNHQYVYADHGRWRFSAVLPPRYAKFDFYTAYKVVVNEPKPYRRASYYRTQYARYKGRHDQEIIRNSHESKYFVIKEHPEHDKWQKEQDNKRNNDRNNNRGNDKNKANQGKGNKSGHHGK